MYMYTYVHVYVLLVMLISITHFKSYTHAAYKHTYMYIHRNSLRHDYLARFPLVSFSDQYCLGIRLFPLNEYACVLSGRSGRGGVQHGEVQDVLTSLVGKLCGWIACRSRINEKCNFRPTLLKF